MATERKELEPHIDHRVYKGISIRELVLQQILTGSADFELLPGYNATCFKFVIVTYELISITGTWSFYISTQSRFAVTVFNIFPVSQTGITTTGQRQLIFNAYSNASHALLDKVQFSVREDVVGTIELKADAIIYS